MLWGGDFGMGHGGGGIFMLVFWGLIFLGIVYLLLSALPKGGSKEEKESDSAQEILEKRFAKGEISQEEFENAMEVLRRNKE